MERPALVKQKSYHARQVSELAPLAQQLLNAHPDTRIFAFFGAMGVGKTTFIQSVCAALGVTGKVSSPSFSIVNHYMTDDGQSIYHFDFYRINKLEEIYDLGYEHYFYSGNYCFIEWPEKLEALLPEHAVRVDMEEDAGVRIVRF
ncbi:MAG: tRNA (adenosine(37)-N6)-threonylcarbamoyltransferase complex ATPase subunit type 1 TsaE [Bacteroidales bacterium]|nr:tRNA (adenosine(37)-N6)-threonylcarbamoyltransferase complex ATPase subunit type 1 TsaE [Bacteroidales bacterium]